MSVIMAPFICVRVKCLLLAVDVIACDAAQVSGVALIALFKEKKEKPRS
jgi:hypothetical protein